MSPRSAFGAFVLGLFLAGCGPARLNMENKYTLDANEAQNVDLDAISKPQTVTIEFSSSASEVSVYLIKNFKADEATATAPSKDQILDYKRAKEGTFSVEVPENTATRVVIRGANAKTDVTLKLTNAKRAG